MLNGPDSKLLCQGRGVLSKRSKKIHGEAQDSVCRFSLDIKAVNNNKEKQRRKQEQESFDSC